ncbi:MAG: trigger factor, partial [Pyrinomonadaceae bacterium]
VKYPEDFTSKGLAGKEVEYTATVTAVRVKELPEMDDEWARSLGEEIDSVEALRRRVRENLTERARHESDHRLRNAVMGKLVEAHQFEVPESLVEHQSQRLIESTVRDLIQRGVDPRREEVNWQAMREMLRPQAREDLRGSLLIERIAEEEQIEVTGEEIEEEIKSLAEASRQTPEQVRAALTKQGGERSIADRLRHRKALDLIVENADVSEEEWREEAEAVATATGDAVSDEPQASAAEQG